MSKLRRKFSSAFKAKDALEALQERETIEFLSKKHDVHPNQILRWKKELTDIRNLGSISLSAKGFQ